MKLNPTEKAVLCGIRSDIEFWRSFGYHDRDQTACRHTAAAREGMANMNLTGWLGRSPSASDKVAASRAYGRLESLGLICRHAWAGSNRTSALSLTDEGTKLAAKLAEHTEGAAR